MAITLPTFSQQFQLSTLLIYLRGCATLRNI